MVESRTLIFRSNENNGTGQSNNGNWVHPMRREDYPRRDDKFYDRLATYENFPESCPVSAENLAKAGFRYTGVNDMVLCDYCQGRLQRWEETDDPIVEHARFEPYKLWPISNWYFQALSKLRIFVAAYTIISQSRGNNFKVFC